MVGNVVVVLDTTAATAVVEASSVSVAALGMVLTTSAGELPFVICTSDGASEHAANRSPKPRSAEIGCGRFIVFAGSAPLAFKWS